MSERIQIEKFFILGKNYSEIAQEPGRHKSSIKREMDRCPKGKYDSLKGLRDAVCKCGERRYNKTKLTTNQLLEKYVREKLAKHWSPQQISVTLKLKYAQYPSMQPANNPLQGALGCDLLSEFISRSLFRNIPVLKVNTGAG